ncbi:hypothetical protein GQX74_013977 [Glossina fuscipes]|nr:hypothetical protein GQX74_013977 [Glossina fuscipes]
MFITVLEKYDTNHAIFFKQAMAQVMAEALHYKKLLLCDVGKQLISIDRAAFNIYLNTIDLSSKILYRSLACRNSAVVIGSPASAYKHEPSLHEHVSPSRELLQHSLQLRGSPRTSWTTLGILESIYVRYIRLITIELISYQKLHLICTSVLYNFPINGMEKKIFFVYAGVADIMCSFWAINL